MQHRAPLSRVWVQGVAETVAAIIDDVRRRGDEAVRQYSKRFDDYTPASFRLGQDEIRKAAAATPETVLDDIRFAQRQVRAFAQRQLGSLSDFETETLPGVFLGQKNIPVAASGAYVPRGRYRLLASAHMTIVTAKVAGVPRVVACTPPIHGELPAESISAMHLAGADEIYLFGGSPTNSPPSTSKCSPRTPAKHSTR